jgi:hypothetical protein
VSARVYEPEYCSCVLAEDRPVFIALRRFG